jgi:transposase
VDEERLNRHDLTDKEWAGSEPLLPPQNVHGARWSDHRVVINGIFRRATATGRPSTSGIVAGRWTAPGRRRWTGCDQAEGADRTVSADFTVVRAHQHAAGPATPRPSTSRKRNGEDHKRVTAGREALGRSRGGLSTKIHPVADRRCRPINRLTTPGPLGDSPQFIPLTESIRIRAGVRPGPASGPRALADKAYSSRADRVYLRKAGYKRSFRSRKTRRSTDASAARPVAVRPASTSSVTRNATPWSGASTSSASSMPWPPIQQEGTRLPGHHRRRLDPHLAPAPG